MPALHKFIQVNLERRGLKGGNMKRSCGKADILAFFFGERKVELGAPLIQMERVWFIPSDKQQNWNNLRREEEGRRGELGGREESLRKRPDESAKSTSGLRA